MPAYLVGAIEIEDREAYAEYVRQALKTVADAGGRGLSIDDEAITLEGTRPAGRMVVFEFPDRDALQRWYDSQDYARVRQLRWGSSSTRFLLSMEGREG